MKIMMGILCVVFCFAAQPSYACSTVGLKKADLFYLINVLEEKIKTQEMFKNSTVERITWEAVHTQSGVDYDCKAMSINSRVTVLVKNSQGKFCAFKGPVEIFKSEVFGDEDSITLAKDVYCMW